MTRNERLYNAVSVIMAAHITSVSILVALREVDSSRTSAFGSFCIFVGVLSAAGTQMNRFAWKEILEQTYNKRDPRSALIRHYIYKAVANILVVLLMVFTLDKMLGNDTRTIGVKIACNVFGLGYLSLDFLQFHLMSKCIAETQEQILEQLARERRVVMMAAQNPIFANGSGLLRLRATNNSLNSGDEEDAITRPVLNGTTAP